MHWPSSDAEDSCVVLFEIRCLILWSTSITNSTVPLLSCSLIYTQRSPGAVIGVASITVIRDTICHRNRDDKDDTPHLLQNNYSCIDPGILYCILKAWNGDRTSKLLSNCNTSKATSPFYLLFSPKLMRSMDKFNTTTTSAATWIIIQQLRRCDCNNRDNNGQQQRRNNTI